jgi:hypothetical protein
MCVRICICHTYIHTHICRYEHVCTYMYVYVCIHIVTSITNVTSATAKTSKTNMPKRSGMCVYVCVVCVCVCLAYICINTYRHTYIHTHVCRRSLNRSGKHQIKGGKGLNTNYPDSGTPARALTHLSHACQNGVLPRRHGQIFDHCASLHPQSAVHVR